MRHRRLLAASVGLALALLAPLPSFAKAQQPAALTWQPVQGGTATEVLNKLEKEHYRKQRFDDALPNCSTAI